MGEEVESIIENRGIQMKIGDSKDRIPIHEEDWEQYRYYLDEMESSLQKLTSDLQSKRQKEEPQVPDEYMVGFDSYYDDRFYTLTQFEIFLLNSFFSFSYFLFEHALMEMCERSKTNRGSSSSIKDMPKQDTLEQVKNYMKGLGMAFPPSGGKDREWNDIQIYNKIRNAIAHNGAIILPKDMKVLLPYAKRKEILADSRTSPRLELSRPFCEEAINTFHHFLLRVWEADPKPTPPPSVGNFSVTQI